MSWFSENAGKIGGTVLLPEFGPAGTFAGDAFDKQNNRQNPTVQGLNLSPAANERAQQIVSAIQSRRGYGTYGEGQIGEAVTQFKKLQEEMNSGKLSQADYVSIANSILPEVQKFGNQLGGGGSRTAGAANAAGLRELNELSGNYNILKGGQDILGRDLTPQEIAILKPKFAGGVDVGNAYLGELAKQEENSPAALGKKAGQYSGDVNKIFDDLLKRGASKEELDYFGRALASGQTTAYQLSQYVQSLPEYQGQQDTAFRKNLQGELSNYDSDAFKRERENILSSYTKAGLQNSSALDFAITDALSKMQTNRDQFLGSLSAQQYGGNKDAALRAYGQSQDQYMGNLDYQRNLGQRNLDYLTQRSDERADYDKQMRDMMNFYGNQPKESSFNRNLNTFAQGTQAVAPWLYLMA